MKKVVLLLIIVLYFASDGLAAPLIWQRSEPDAISLATRQGKLILLIAGRKGCGNCKVMKEKVCESPAVKSLIRKHFIPWYCDIDSCFEWFAYNSGLKKLTLPMICCIDPLEFRHLDRTVGFQSPKEFYSRLKKIVSAFNRNNGKGRGETYPAFEAQKDCSGVPGGSAYTDDCGNCVAGSTGLHPCSKAECSIFGKVTDARTEFPVEGASVEVKNDMNSYRARTDGRGSYSIENIGCSTYKLKISKENYNPFWDNNFEINGHISFSIPLHP
ncbi:carboxypeptidase regulatory-like domain-containing protein [Desulfobacterales bacterium HSG2]|nr:carboxypeptidase regulatory-like domain-containing protein [Desulfobacterales bacterium HSG2]